MSKILHRVQFSSTENKVLNTLWHCIIKPNRVLEATNSKEYLSPVNYFLSIVGISFFIFILLNTIKGDLPNHYYWIPNRVGNFLLSNEAFSENFAPFAMLILVTPINGLIFYAFFFNQGVNKVIRITIFSFATQYFIISIILLVLQILSESIGNNIKPLFFIGFIYLIYFLIVIDTGKLWVKILKILFILPLIVTSVEFVSKSLRDYLFVNLIHSEKILFEHPDAEVFKSQTLISNPSSISFSKFNNSTHSEFIIGTYSNDSAEISWTASDEAIIKRINIAGRPVKFSAITADSAILLTAISGSRDSLEYGQLSFIDLKERQVVKSIRLKPNFFTINDMLADKNIIITGGMLNDSKKSIPIIYQFNISNDFQLFNDSTMTLDQSNARGHTLAFLNDELYLTTYKKADKYIYDLSLHSIKKDSISTYRLFEKQTNFSPYEPIKLTTDTARNILMTEIYKTNFKTIEYDIKIFNGPSLTSPRSIKVSSVADIMGMDEFRIINDKIIILSSLQYLIHGSLKFDKVNKFGLIQVYSLNGELLESRIITSNSHCNYDPIKMVSVANNELEILAYESRPLPLFRELKKLVVTKIELKTNL